MKKILVIQPIRPEAIKLFEDRDDIRFEVVTDFSKENLLARVRDADAITVRDAPLPAEVLAAAPNLRVVSRHGVGYDNIPVDYCTARGIPVTVVGDVNAISVAEQTMFLMLAASKWGVALDQAVRKGDFAARSRLLGVELRGRTLLVVGFGRIGREVAKRSAAFGMNILVHDPFAKSIDFDGARLVASLEEGLAAADVVSLHIPLSPATRNLIDTAALARMPKGGIVLNTARGGIIDEDALAAALASGHLRAAGLDTFETEPLPADHPLVLSDRVILSPHSAALTDEALIGMGVMAAKNALCGLDGTLDPALVVNGAALKVMLNEK